jgi:hypothetical protein
VDRRRAAGRSGKTGAETNHAACQDEKVGYLAAGLSGWKRNRGSRARGRPALRVVLRAAHELAGGNGVATLYTYGDPRPDDLLGGGGSEFGMAYTTRLLMGM